MSTPSAVAADSPITYRKIEAGHYAVMQGGQCVARLLCWRDDGSFPIWHAYLNPKPCPAPIAVTSSLKSLKRHIGALLAAQAAAPAGHQVNLVSRFGGEITTVDHRQDWYPEPHRYDIDNPPPALPRWVESVPARRAEAA